MLRILLTSASLLALTSTSAFADCTPDPAVDFDSVTCVGSDTDGFESLANSLDIVVEGDVTVDPGDAIKVEGADNTVTVEEDAIVDGEDEAIVGGAGLTVINDGEIYAGDKAIDADDLADVSVFNTGIIDAGDKGIRVGSGANALLDNTGDIFAGDEGFEAGDFATVFNSGIIFTTVDDAIQVGDDALITNLEDGLIVGGFDGEGGDGIDVDSGRIENEGLIGSLSEGEAGIDVDSGTSLDLEVVNYGDIFGDFGILADPENTQAQIIFNDGIIEGLTKSLDLGLGDDVYETGEFGQLIGDAMFGAGMDQLILSDDLTTPFSMGSIIDGGADDDTVFFGPSVSSMDIIAAVLYGVDDIGLTIEGPLTTYSMRLANWEFFDFADGTFTASEFSATPIPLPAPIMLLGMSVVGLGVVSRRRRTA